MQIDAELVFLQIQPRGPLIRVDRRTTPMSRSRRLVIRFDSAARQDGLAARPCAERSSLDCFETHASRAQIHRSQWKICCQKP